MNAKIRQVENQIINIINNSGLPPEVLRIILGKLEAQTTTIANQEIQKELKEGEKDAESV